MNSLHAFKMAGWDSFSDDPVFGDPVSDSERCFTMRTLIDVCSALLVGLGVLVLAGWMAGSETLTCVLAGHVSMKPNTAIGFILAGGALAAQMRVSVGWRWTARVLATLAMVCGALSLLEYVLGVDLHIDEWLFADPVKHLYPGRMSFLTALNFTLTGLALLMAGAGRLLRGMSQGVALLVAGAAFAAIAGKLYGVEMFYSSQVHTAMAVHTGIGFLVLALAIALLDGESTLVRLLHAPGSAGVLFRRSLPWVVAVPLLLGWVYLQPVINFGRPHFGMALFAVTLVGAGSVALWRAAIFLTHAEQQKTALALAREEGQAAVRAGEQRRSEAEVARQQSAKLERVNRQLEQLATTDRLTGLKNRGEFELRLQRAFKRAQRNRGSLAVLMIDVDHFKSRNDSWGHAAGDAVLQRLGAVFADAVREPDVAARYGGEEFTILLQGSAAAGAWSVAERLRRTIAAQQWEHAAVTVSVGVAEFAEMMLSAEALLGAADVALYEAKRGGRNRVCGAVGDVVAADLQAQLAVYFRQ